MGKSESDELVDEIEQIRLRLASTVGGRVDRAHPESNAQRSRTRRKGCRTGRC